MSESAAMLSTMESVQMALSVVQAALALTAYQMPASCSPANGSFWDFIIVGGGSAGCVLANRLAQNTSNKVLLLEDGGYYPYESQIPLGFPLLPETKYDFNISAVNNGYTAQNLQNNTVSLTQGKGLGGSSIVHHMIHVQPNRFDMQEWAISSGDDSWNYTNMLPYLIKMEQLIDPVVLNSTTAKYHGTEGYMKIAREPSSTNENYLNAFAELGHKIQTDVSGPYTEGYSEPLFNIAGGQRQSNALAYLDPVKDYSNLCVALYTTANKILFNDSTTASGVQAVDSSGNTLVLNANKEVIITAGAIHSPQLLFVSGIGNQTQLENMGINPVADQPNVGKNFHDHPGMLVAFQMKESNATTPASDPGVFPVPTTTGYVALDSSQEYPDYQTINLVFPHDSTALVQLCSKVFKYSNDICDKMYAASNSREVLLVVFNLLKPWSSGEVVMTSADSSVQPDVYMGTFSNSSDLTLAGKCLVNFYEVMNTTYFQSVNATLVDLDLCSGDPTSTDYWECYAVAMSATMWHYSGTCALGSVLDSNLKVKGFNNLRVADSSAMPTGTSGNINAAVTALAEKAAALIASEWELD